MKRIQTIFLSLAFAVSANAEINVADSIIESQEPTVSLGYTEVNKADINSAIVTLSADELTDVTTCDLGTMLQGKVAGLQVINPTGQPGSSAEMIIRGLNSTSSGAAPIYVVDGVIGGAFNPNDIETVSVLKDAGSAALYGGAAGGVFVITTKSGAYDSKPHVTIRSRVGAAMPQFGNFVPMQSEELYRFHQSLYTPTDFDTRYPALSELADYNWRNEVFRNSLIQNHYVSVAGGGKRVGYYCSLDYYGENGTMQSTGMQKFAGHAALKIDVCKWLDMHIKTDFASSKTNRPYSGRMISDAFYKLPWDCPYAYDADGNLTNQYVRIDQGTRPDNGGKWWSSEMWNSLHSAQYNYDRLEGFSFAASLQLNFHITDWLHFTSTNSYDFGSCLFSSYIDPRTYDTNFKDGYLGKQPGEGSNFITTNILRAAYTWGDHSVSGLIGGEYGLWKSEYFTADGIKMLDGMDALNVVTPLSVGGTSTKGLSYGVFAQVGYDYAKRYFINAAYRCGASSRYAPGSLQGHFPSVSAAWLISNEAFMQEQNIVSFLKLRANYIFTSNNRASDDLPDYTSSHFTDPGMVVVIPPSIFSGRKHTNTYTVGIDLAFINRIDMSIDLYQTDYNEFVDIYIVSPYGGYYSQIEEYKMRNRGIDYRLDAQVLNMNDLRWNVGFNIAFNQLTLTELPDYVSSFSYTSSPLKVGEDPYTWYMKEWAGVNPANGDPLWYRVDADGNYILNAAGNKTVTSNYNAALPHAVGNPKPLFFGGLNTQVSWKGLALSINTNFTYGNKIYNYTRHSMDADGAYLGYNQLSMDNNRLGWSRWTQPGDIATHPKAVLGGNQNANQISSRYLEDGSFFRLKNITLSYDFCATLIPQKYMSKLRIFISADNVATATRFSGVNPDVSSGEYRETYPLARTIVGGIEIEF